MFEARASGVALVLGIGLVAVGAGGCSSSTDTSSDDASVPRADAAPDGNSTPDANAAQDATLGADASDATVVSDAQEESATIDASGATDAGAAMDANDAAVASDASDAADVDDASDAADASDAGDANDAGSAIGPLGGSVTSTDGKLTIQVPAGALSSDVAITIAPTTNAPAGALGAVYDIEPSGTTFAKPVTLVFQNDRSYAAWASVGTVVNGAWQAIPVSVVDAQTLRAQTTHLSMYGVIAPIPCTDSSGCQAPFQCVSNLCLIPCRDTTDCPSPLACRGGSCHSVACSADGDCKTALTQSRPSGDAVACDTVARLCIDDDPSVLPGTACPAGPVTQGVCPAGQVEVCGTCTFQSCPCGTNAQCAEGVCWPKASGCTCGQQLGCSCGGGVSVGDGGVCTPGGPIPDAGPPVAMAGDWYGVWQSGVFWQFFWMHVNQNGTAMSGSGNSNGPTTCMYDDATGTGTISGDEYSATFTQVGGNYGAFCGFVSGGNMVGAFQVTMGNAQVCGPGGSGTFQMMQWDYTGPIP